MKFEPGPELLRRLGQAWAGPEDIPMEIKPKPPEHGGLNDYTRLVSQLAAALPPDEEGGVGIAGKIIIEIKTDADVGRRAALLGGRRICRKELRKNKEDNIG